ncbi:MAG: hypothetical protein G01um101419_32 [Parcubacteria group bacterium Gr01-1014_19]|nr:MAG: hypothetical protein G01um101419_32 [Parcubacteria group bacterium Gr01-1014_19]
MKEYLLKELNQIWTDLKKVHPVLKSILLFILLVTPISAISLIWQIKDAELLEASKDMTLKSPFWPAVYHGSVKAPIIEELTFRGPAYVLLLTLLLISYLYSKKTGKPSTLQMTVWPGWTVAELIVWPMLLLLNYFWAIDHPYPATVFAAGLVLGWLMLKTKNILYCIVLHAGVNFVVIAASRVGTKLLS